MLSVINVGTEGHNTADACGISLARASRGCVHDTIFSVAQEIGRTAESIQHARAHDTGAIGVGIDIHLDGCVHANDSETADDFRRVGNLL